MGSLPCLQGLPYQLYPVGHQHWVAPYSPMALSQEPSVPSSQWDGPLTLFTPQLHGMYTKLSGGHSSWLSLSWSYLSVRTSLPEKGELELNFANLLPVRKAGDTSRLLLTWRSHVWVGVTEAPIYCSGKGSSELLSHPLKKIATIKKHPWSQVLWPRIHVL